MLNFLALVFLFLRGFALAQTNSSWPTQNFVTTAFHPPVLNISSTADASGGYLFFAPDGTPALNPYSSPLIMDMDGELVWNGPQQHAFNFGVETYKGEKVLVAWNGTVFREPIGRGNGEVLIWNNNYEVIATVTLPGNFAELTPGETFPSNIDLHEQLITERGTLVVTANNVTQMDLTSVGGSRDGWVTEAQVYEIDIASNKVLFSWKSLDHLEQLFLTASVYPLGSEGQDGKNQSNAWGYFHINSVEPFSDGYIISSRYLCSAIAIDRTGKVLWRLSGRDGADFKLGDGVDFCYQHDIRVVEEHGRHGKCSNLTLQLHDNHNCPIDKNIVPTSGKVIHLDLITKKATFKQRFLDEAVPIYATAQGSHQRMENGNIFEGFGYVPVMQEFEPNGHVLSTIQFGDAPERPGGGFLSPDPSAVTLSYRAYKQHWIGCPHTKPSVVVNGNRDRSTVYVSWNGATEVEAWEVHGTSGGRMKHIATAKKIGFETKMEVKGVSHVQVKPVLRHGAPKDRGQHVKSEVLRV